MENTQKTGFAKKLDNFFGITERGSNFKTEIMAGIVTFLAMAYILTVNPNNILYTNKVGDPFWPSIFMATAFGALVGTLLMAFLAKLPLAQAPGMGLNAQVGGLIGGASGAFATGAADFNLAQAMMLVLISGVIFLALSIINIKGKSLRQYIFEGIPTSLKVAIPAGIGLFIAFIGFQNAGVIVTNGYTQVGMIKLTNWGAQLGQWGELAATGEKADFFGTELPTYFQIANVEATAQAACVCFIGLFAITIMSHFKIKGAVIFGILFATVIGIPLHVTDVSYLYETKNGVSWEFWNNFANFFSCGENSSLGIAFKGGWEAFSGGKVFVAIMTIISFSMIDMFDTMGTCLGCCSEAGLLDENGTPIAYDKIMYADSIATCTGALFGTSTVTTFVESGAGIAAGGKTGLTALVTAILFFLSMFLMPVFAMIPPAAAASALVYVGVLMMKNITKVNFDAIRVAVPAFLTIIMMPLAYSITTGIGVGILSFVIISIITYLIDLIKFKACKDGSVEKPEWKISVFTAIVAILFGVYFFVPF